MGQTLQPLRPTASSRPKIAWLETATPADLVARQHEFAVAAAMLHPEVVKVHGLSQEPAHAVTALAAGEKNVATRWRIGSTGFTRTKPDAGDP